ncbi:MAG TPA: electron transfer flavoprotein subunit alpha/FixB family protein [Actinomycetota bacterium]|nr:electron transfer flavoprotein subunit alpha/FixB family protein [Actinomycetota bacterium]
MILGLVEHDGGVLPEPSLQMLTLGRRLAERLGEPLAALVIGPDAGPGVDGLAAYGVSVVHHAVDDRLDRFAPGAWAACVADLMGRTGPSAILAAGTDRGNEVMAHVGARTGLPVAANCTEAEPGEPGDPYLVTRLRWGGSLLEDARLHGDVKLLTVAPHAVRAEEGPAAGEWSVGEFSPKLQDADFRVQVARQEARPAGKVSLPEARVVVGGGRGVGSPEGFGPLEELAELLGGVVGCSRVVTSLGWRPHTDQVGQTGVRIAPDVYIACGISGAIQHMVGAKGAKRILVVNTDAQAPILAHADYAIIGDVQQVVPALVSAIKETKSR